MILQDLFEKTIISGELHDKLEQAIQNWLREISTKVGTDDQDAIKQYIIAQHQHIAESLRKKVQPTINKIVKDNITHTPSDEHYKGHRVGIVFDIDKHGLFQGTSGSVHRTWRKTYINRNDYVMKVILSIDIPLGQLQTWIVSSSIPDSLLATITHELIHLIQVTRSNPIKGNIAKPLMKRQLWPQMTRDEHYYIDKVELDAYAQGTVTKIIAKSKSYPDPKEWIKGVLNLLKYGMNQVFGREVFPVQQYNTIKTVLTTPSQDMLTKRAKLRGWKYYNKRMYEKLQDYMDTLK